MRSKNKGLNSKTIRKKTKEIRNNATRNTLKAKVSLATACIRKAIAYTNKLYNNSYAEYTLWIK